MLPDRVSNLGPLTYESGALPIALRGPAGESRQDPNHVCDTKHTLLTLKAPITIAADDTYKYFFIVFQRNKT